MPLVKNNGANGNKGVKGTLLTLLLLLSICLSANGNKGVKGTIEGVTIPHQPTISSAHLRKETEGGDVRVFETVTVHITARKNLTGKHVEFTVDGIPQGRATLRRAQDSFTASFSARQTTSSGPITVAYEGEAVAIEERFWLVQNHPSPPPHVHSYYTQGVEVGSSGFWVVGSEVASPRAISHAAWEIEQITTDRPEILTTLGSQQGYMVILGYQESINVFMRTSTRSYRWFLKPINWFLKIIRNAGIIRAEPWRRGWYHRGNVVRPLAAVGEERILNYRYRREPTLYYSLSSTVIHEFAHLVHFFAMDKTFNIRVRDAYKEAVRSGRWGSSYAASNHWEFFAEATLLWFDAIDTTGRNSLPDSYTASLHFYPATHEDLIKREPRVAALVEEAFGNLSYRWKPARGMLYLPHLEGYDHILTPQYEEKIFY